MAVDRRRLAQEQEELVRALVAGALPPPGFDPVGVARAARSLIAKRRRESARAWPTLAACLGKEYRALFDAYAATHPPPGDPVEDGRRFARSLPPSRLDDDTRLALLSLFGTARVERGWAIRLPWLGTVIVPLLGRRRGAPPPAPG